MGGSGLADYLSLRKTIIFTALKKNQKHTCLLAFLELTKLMTEYKLLILWIK